MHGGRIAILPIPAPSARRTVTAKKIIDLHDNSGWTTIYVPCEDGHGTEINDYLDKQNFAGGNFTHYHRPCSGVIQRGVATTAHGRPGTI